MKYLMTQADSGIRGYGTLILAHGAGAPMDSDFMNQLADILAQFGVTVVRFEFPYMSQRRKDGKKRPPNRTPQLIECFEAVIADIDAMPTLPKTFFSVPPHSGHSRRDSSLKDWTISNWWSQSLQRYS